jgi:hypothetical protein
MLSLNIKDYILAILIVVILGLSASSLYYKTRLDVKVQLIEQHDALAVAQKEKIKLLKKQSKRTEEYLNEKYDVELSILNSTIDGMRDKHRESILPSLPKGSSDPSRICFKREALDEAVQGYRYGVQDLIKKGNRAVIGLNIAKEWVEEETLIYGE